MMMKKVLLMDLLYSRGYIKVRLIWRLEKTIDAKDDGDW